jgi:hypothetical protein
MHQEANQDIGMFTPFTHDEDRVAERYTIIAGFVVLIASFAFPAIGVTGAMLAGALGVAPMVSYFWKSKRSTVLTLAVLCIVLVSPAMYGLARVTVYVGNYALNLIGASAL